MFYFLSEFRELHFAFNIFKYITFRTGMAALTTFLICVIFGPYFIQKLRLMKIGEVAKRADTPGLDKFHGKKEGTPTMGGLFIIGSIVVSVLLWGNLSNHFVLLTLFTCIYLAVLGWVDDYHKLKKLGNKRGLTKRAKMMWEILLGCFVGSYVFFNPGTSTQLDLPFFKDAILNLGVFYIPFVALIVIGTSNAVNLTDGLDGLAIGCVLVVSITLAVLSYITGHMTISHYLFIPYVPAAAELTIVASAMVGASLGFLWFNCHPATVFMGDTGSLALGGTLGVMAVLIKKELLLVIIGGVFVIEALSVILQVFSFRIFGKRIFKMAPFHHHLQMSGWEESKIIIRFWILAVILALVALTTLKIR
ncbi:MAG: phospho-N-acetylmuramoyl-pentapeptide-transferase [Candidatus Omnitrophica bacterium]|nr:phospho-N-acetylmuramoyl-pentapeptide-transferase [Candidatus Omnitrophota bacterium]